MQPETAGIHGSQIGSILDASNRIDNGPDFFDAQYRGKGLIPFGMDELQVCQSRLSTLMKKNLMPL